MCKLPMYEINLYRTFVKLLLHNSRQIIIFILKHNMTTNIKNGENTETGVCLWFSRLVSLLQHWRL